MEEREIRLIKRAQDGDPAAFEALVIMYDRQVLRLAYRLVNNLEDARDIYQDVFLLVYRKLSSFRFESEFYTWLYRIVVNQCINFRKWRRRRQAAALTEPDTASSFSARRFDSGEPNPEDGVIHREAGAKIQLALTHLSEKQRAVFVLRHFHDMKLQDIARSMGCADGTVKNYLFRATQKMQELLRDYQRAE
jgi:RNA polymerase sigma-70 factor (ECF subfamily)